MSDFDALVSAFLNLCRGTEFDPGQKRADDGKWTDGGGGGSDQHVHSVKASNSESISKSLPKGLNTKSSDLALGEKPKHSFRWMGKSEVEKVLAGKHTYGGSNTSELDAGNWWSSTPGDFKGYGQYLMEVDVPQGNGFGLAAPKGSVGAKNVVDIWKYDPIKDEFVSAKVAK